MDYSQLKPFPANFMWGASSSAYQCEGAYDEDGKGLSIQDMAQPAPGNCDVKVASDHYHHFKEDIELMAEMGFNEYRFSISWPRIIPDGEGEINAKGVQHYHEVIDCCLEHHIQPVVTLYHFDLPLALQEKYGGWVSRKTIDAFVKYCSVCFKKYGTKVKYFLTINEQNMMTLFNMGKHKSDQERYQANHHMLVASARAMKACHDLCDAWIAPAPNITVIYPKTSAPSDYLASMDYDQLRNRLYIDPLVFGEYPQALKQIMIDQGFYPEVTEQDLEDFRNAHPDFIAFNYYGGTTVRYISKEEGDVIKERASQFKLGKANMQEFMTGLMTEPGIAQGCTNDFQDKTSYGMSVDPIGLISTMRQLWERYHLPLLITENGCGVEDTLTEDGKVHDDYRIDYLRLHIQACQKALHEGIQLMGYSPWSAFDLVSTHQGIRKRYGLIYVDRDDESVKECKRIRKDSFYWYKKVVASNGSDLY